MLFDRFPFVKNGSTGITNIDYFLISIMRRSCILKMKEAFERNEETYRLEKFTRKKKDSSNNATISRP